MRKDFCAFILSHGRPERVYTYNTLLQAGYTGKIYIVIDDEDKKADEYRLKFGNKVLQFCKIDIEKILDKGDNFDGRASTIYPRAAFWNLAKQVGCKYFIQLDDDYTEFQYFYDRYGNYKYQAVKKTCDQLFESMLDYFIQIPCMSIAMAQGGDFLGGGKVQVPRLRRKAMNTFFCSVDRPFNMFGRRNEDVNTYVLGSLRGELFFTVIQAKITQIQSQINPGAISQSYIESGTYVKSFYTIMYAPSCVKIGIIHDHRASNPRIHHQINWHNCAPKIIDEKYKKPKA